MSAVRFAIGSKPGLSEREALGLARLLEIGRNLAAFQLAGRIRRQAELSPDRPPLSEDIELERLDLEQIAAVFADGPDLLEVPAYSHLHDEVLKALASR